jgi:hypothetical protein
LPAFLGAGGSPEALRRLFDSVAPRRDERTRINSIRVNGRDVALELRESSCGSEACTDGCGEPIACHVWCTPERNTPSRRLR